MFFKEVYRVVYYLRVEFEKGGIYFCDGIYVIILFLLYYVVVVYVIFLKVLIMDLLLQRNQNGLIS